MVVLSTLIVSLGLLADNVVLVIGGMMVTPILSPILAISLGIVINEHKVIKRSIRIFLTAFAFAFLTALIIGFFSTTDVAGSVLVEKMQPSLFIFIVAVVAGVAASYTWAKPGLNDMLPGIAVTVTLIPPLTAIGLAIADGEWVIFANVLKTLLINIAGIIFSSLVILSLMDFYKAKEKVVAEVRQEERQIKKEKEKAEKVTN